MGNWLYNSINKSFDYFDELLDLVDEFLEKWIFPVFDKYLDP